MIGNRYIRFVNVMNPVLVHSDQELARLLSKGNESAFEQIYRKYWDKLLAVAGRRLGNIEEGEEAVQDIFLNLWRRRETFKLSKGFENYFAVAVKFEVINRLAKRAREASRNSAFADQSSEETHGFFRFDFDVLCKELEDVICSLPPKCQLVFRMSREQDYSNREIAEELKISEKAVEKHVTSALKVLRTRFGQYLTILLFFI